MPGESVGGRLAQFQRNWEAICRDWSQRWGRRVSGWWIDGCYFADEIQMDHLSCKTPENLAREIRFYLLVHNLVRRVMLEAARRHRAPLSRLSFAGALAACRRCGEPLLQARSQRQHQELLDSLFAGIAADLLPDRPGRREPRAVKRRPKPYPRLICHRSPFKEIQHQNRY